MDYLVGDLQGCDRAFERLLAAIGFTPSRDRLVVLGDLVNRGPGSLAVLRRLQRLDAAAACVLGNHDLHLLAVAAGARDPHRNDTFGDVLADPERECHLRWLRTRPLALKAFGWLCVHAGVVPAWTEAETLALAAEVSALLAGPAGDDWLRQMYGNAPARWDPLLEGAARTRTIVNVLTRIRFCAEDGALDLETKEGAGAAPPGMRPWFEWPHRATRDTPVASGHWSTLGLVNRPGLLAIDTGCVWGGALTAVRVDGGRREVIQVACEEEQAPGT